MQNTKTNELTPEQTAWDAKNRLYTRNSYIALGVWMVLNIGSFTWVVVDKIVPYFALHGLSRTDPVQIAAADNSGDGLLLLVLIVLVSAILSLPIRRTVSTAFWILGDRPSDDYKPYVPKPIDIAYEQVSDELRIARVGDWAFEVKRYSYDRFFKFRKPEYGYEIKDQSGFMNHTLVLTPDTFKGKNDPEVEKTIHNRISSELERHTDYFKTFTI